MHIKWDQANGWTIVITDSVKINQSDYNWHYKPEQYKVEWFEQAEFKI